MASFGYSVFEFGAVGDGVADDTAAIQKGINFLAERGGGKLLFPFTKGGYRIASDRSRTVPVLSSVSVETPSVSVAR